MGWRATSTGARWGEYWVHDTQIGMTEKNHTCPDCGFTGNFIVFLCKDWWVPYLIPRTHDYYLGECPQCKVIIDIDY